MHKPWCTCTTCQKSTVDLSIFPPETQMRLHNIRLAVMHGLYSDWDRNDDGSFHVDELFAACEAHKVPQ